jgi:hypothetical protein
MHVRRNLLATSTGRTGCLVRVGLPSSVMSLHPTPIGEIPDETVRVAKAAFPKGTLATRLRDEFADLFGACC